MRVALWAISVALASSPSQAADPVPAASASAAAVAFGAREKIADISLSPDGSKIAYIVTSAGSGTALVVRGSNDADTPRRIVEITDRSERLRSCSWASNARLVCSVGGVVDVIGRNLDFSRTFAIDADGSNLKQLGTRQSSYTRGLRLFTGSVIDWLPEEEGVILMSRPYLPDDHTGSNLGSKKEGLGVDRIDTRNLAARTLEQPRRDAVQYITDGRGTVRIMGSRLVASGTELSTSIIRYSYRRPNSREWERLGDFDTMSGTGFEPVAVDRDLNVAYGLKKKDGRFALYSVALDGTAKETLLFARPDVDVDGLARIGRRQRVVGAHYQTDVPEVAYFDADMERLARSLGKAVATQPSIQVIDSTLDERKLLVFGSGDSDPGTYYLFDRDKRDLHAFAPARPELEGRKLATVKPVRYPAADGTIIPAYLTLPPDRGSAKGLPAIVLPHGGPASRDEWGFDWLSQYYASQGYAVIQPQFRGSSGYGDAWFLQNGFRSWRIAVGDVADAGRWLVAQGIADPTKLSIVGWSYGGYAALQSAVLAPGLFKSVVAIAPVTDLAMLKAESLGWTDSAVNREFIGTGPEVRAGSPAQNAEKIKVPVLLIHGTKDANVGYNESKLMEAQLRSSGGQVRLITFEGLDHQLNDSAARTQLLLQSDQFMRDAVAK